MQESTIIAIRTILEAAFDRHEQDTPEERVKIYSRIERTTFDKEKYGEYESCPICCIEMEDTILCIKLVINKMSAKMLFKYFGIKILLIYISR